MTDDRISGANDRVSGVEDRRAEQPAADSAGGVPKIKWDDSQMRSSYANVCNASFTREEVILLFGMNQAWQSGQKELSVQLTDRVILSPFAAKRLTLLLANVVREYENRFGALNLETATK